MSKTHGTPANIVWFRHDLRISDNPALHAACERGRVLPVFIWSPEEEGDWPPGAASRWWLHHSLAALTQQLAAIGLPLLITHGATDAALLRTLNESGAQGVLWNRRFEPAVVERDTKLKQSLRDAGFSAESCNASLLFEPWDIKTQQGTPYKVYTPFFRACMSNDVREPLPAPEEALPPTLIPKGLELDDLALLPTIRWDDGLARAWTPGASGAHAELKRFLRADVDDYDEARNKPAVVGTSRLSPYLHFGEIGPREIWAALKDTGRRSGKKGVETFRKELIWREFAYHLLFHFPETPLEPLRPEFKNFPWNDSPEMLKAWQRGRTGYPIVDAGMRELWETGWMHNRVRMIVASFLVKDLLIPWQHGARWFWDTLVDADLASNTLGWQWTAGCGADAAPFFRVFNPMLQGSKFDPEGEYIRRWCPELRNLPDKQIHCPWEASEAVRKQAGVELGADYPHRIVDHAEARDAALEAYEEITSKKTARAENRRRSRVRQEQMLS